MPASPMFLGTVSLLPYLALLIRLKGFNGTRSNGRALVELTSYCPLNPSIPRST